MEDKQQIAKLKAIIKELRNQVAHEQSERSRSLAELREIESFLTGARMSLEERFQKTNSELKKFKEKYIKMSKFLYEVMADDINHILNQDTKSARSIKVASGEPVPPERLELLRDVMDDIDDFVQANNIILDEGSIDEN